MKVESLSEVAHHARKRFDRFASAYHRDDAFPARLPPGEGLHRLLEEAFWASISRDEGRTCRFTLAYYQHEPGRANPDIAIALDPRPFSRDLLRRLAAVAFAADAKIAVAGVDGNLHVIGLIKRLRQRPEVSTPVNMPVEIEVIGPAHIAIRYAIFRTLTYRNGCVPEPAPNILLVAGPFRKALDRLAAAEGIPGEAIRFKLKILFDQVERHAHGGLFILSLTEPNGLESISWKIINDVCCLADVHRLWWDNLSRLKLPKKHPDRLSFDAVRDRQRDLHALESEVLALSASVALTDGALWLNGSLQPRAFGVFAQLEPARPVKIASDAAGTHCEEMRFDDLGARHRAMVALAGQNTGCPAIAISSDGGFSAAIRIEGREDVIVWRFQGGDLEVDDPFDPQYGAIWEDLLARTTARQREQGSSPPAS